MIAAVALERDIFKYFKQKKVKLNLILHRNISSLF